MNPMRLDEEAAGGMPRALWTLWTRAGTTRPSWSNPELVKHCLQSWAHHNPGWPLRALDRDSLPAYVGLDAVIPFLSEESTIMVASDLVRLDLLHAHGPGGAKEAPRSGSRHRLGIHSPP